MTLLESISTPKKIRRAWKKLAKSPNSKGIDEISIKDFEANLDAHLLTIRKQLRAGTYKFEPLRGVSLPKPSGKRRLIKVAIIRDRVVQKAIELAISEPLTKKYNLNNPTSYAYLKGRGIGDAVEAIRSHYNNGNTFILECDITQFFDTVNRDKLLEQFIFPELSDDTLNDLIKSALAAEVGNKDELIAAGKWEKYFPKELAGIPQGSILSPLFSNVYLNPLDMRMISDGLNLVRYADDFIVACKSQKEGYAAFGIADEVLKELGLELHPLYIPGKGKKPDKYSSVVSFNDGFDFVGLRFVGRKVYPSGKSFGRMQDVLKTVPGNGTLLDDLHFLNRRINAWGATYRFTNYSVKLYEPLEQALVTTTERTLSKHNLKPITGKVDDEQLDRLGLTSFNRVYTYHQQRYRDKLAAKTEKLAKSVKS